MREKLNEIKKFIKFKQICISAEIDQTLLTKEVNGSQKLSVKHYQKIREVFHDIGRKLLEI